jgi:carbamoylphosphate synthase large subunit
MKKIVVTGSGGPAGVNFINSLRFSEEKIYVVGTDTNRYHLQWPDIDKRYLTKRNDDDGYLDQINEIIAKEGIEFLHPQPDTEVYFFSENREKVNAKTFLPEKETIRTCQDKFKSSQIWEKSGIPLGKSFIVKDLDGLKDIGNSLGYPYWLRATHGAGGRGSTPVENLETAKNWMSYWKNRGVDWEFVAQEYLPGKNIAFQSIWNNGELVTSQARERIEYIYPYLAPSGVTGTPVVAKTVNRKDINEMATKCVLSIDKKATGIFCVDLKENKQGIPCPTEINAGRFFTTSFFFTKAGINMPYYYVKLAYGEEIPKLPKYNSVKEGLYWIRHIDCPAKLIEEDEFNFNK